MSTKDDLHRLVDQLDDDDAIVALAYLREVLDAESVEAKPRRKSLDERMGPRMVSGKEFFAEKPRKTLAEIAEEQGVRPIRDIDDLRADFWPEDEPVDEFVETIRRWRREGGFA